MNETPYFNVVLQLKQHKSFVLLKDNDLIKCQPSGAMNNLGAKKKIPEVKHTAGNNLASLKSTG